ncbi:MAG: hypothetical protein ACRDJH_03575 [Thermomicrobiales bacterium]
MPATMIANENEPVAPTGAEQTALDALRRLLACEEPCELRLTGADGASLEVPPSVARVLRQAVPVLARGRAVMVDNLPLELTIYDAADLLGLRPEDIDRLVEEGRLPSTLVRDRPRIPLDALMAYKVEYDAERRAAMTELVRISEELGLYEIDETA